MEGLKSKRVAGVSQDRNREFITLIVAVYVLPIPGRYVVPSHLSIGVPESWRGLRKIQRLFGAGGPGTIPTLTLCYWTSFTVTNRPRGHATQANAGNLGGAQVT